MAHYAEINESNVVVQVIVADQDFVDSLQGTWLQTSYNTRGGQHILGGQPLRKNFAGVGYHYDSELDAFIPPKPYTSWILDTSTCTWQAPIPKPDGSYYWDENANNWIIMEQGI